VNHLFLSFIALLVVSVSTASHARECAIKRARVSHVWQAGAEKKRPGNTFRLENLDKKAFIRFKLDVDDPQYLKYQEMFRKGLKDPQLFFNIHIEGDRCRYLAKRNNFRRYIKPSAITSIEVSKLAFPACLDCLDLYNPPMVFMLPTPVELVTLFSDVMQVPENKGALMTRAIVELLEDFDPKTEQGNSIAFPAFFLLSLHKAGLSGVGPQQMDGLKQLFANSLKGDEVELLNKIISKIDSIEFEENESGELTVILNTPGEGITLTKDEIPVSTPAQIELLEQYFESFFIENGAKLTFLQSEKRKVEMKMEGIVMVGKFPVLGPIQISNIKIRPEVLSFIEGREVPVHMDVSFKKFLKFHKNFEFNY
jgi:hypothetical protein